MLDAGEDEEVKADEKINIQDLLNQNFEVSSLEDMEKVEKILEEMRKKEEQDRQQEDNRSEILDANEAQDDDQLKLILQE